MLVYRCKYCGKEFDSIYALAGHIRMSHPKHRRRRKKNVEQRSASLSNVEQCSAFIYNSKKVKWKKFVWMNKRGDVFVITVPEDIYNILEDMDKKNYLVLSTDVFALGYFIKRCGLGDFKIRKSNG